MNKTMNSTENEGFPTHQSTTTPAVLQKEQSGNSHSDKLKLMNSTPNGYSSNVSNHKIRPEDPSLPKKSHDAHKHSSESSKQNSDHVKHKDSSPSKHSSSSHSKHKDGMNKSSSSHKSSDPSKHKEHSHDKEKKHKHGSEHHSDKHMKNDVDRIKTDDKSHKDKSLVNKHSVDGVKSEKPKEKPKDGHSSSEHKIKDKSKEHKKTDSLSKDKSDKQKLSEKTKEKSSEKIKDKSGDKLKEKPKEKSGDKHKINDKPKDKSNEKKLSKEKSSDFSKEKSKGDKPKEVVKIKKERESSPEKKDLSKKESMVIKREIDSDFRSEPTRDRISDVKIKQEVTSPMKSYYESADEDDEPPEKKGKSGKRVKEESDYEDEYAPKPKAKKKIEAGKKRKKEADSDFEEVKKQPVKKIKKEQKGARKEVEVTTTSPKKRGKKEEEQDVWKWWEEDKKEDGVKWNTLSHCGPVFAPPYERVPKNVKFYYDGKHMELSEQTEEVAGFYGRMLDHDYTTKDAFNTNFFKDWKKVMTPEEKEIIRDLRKCNFNAFNEYYKLKSEERKNMTKEEKNEIKKQNEELQHTYGYCVIDGHRQKIGNFKIEPPGLFRGRGEHPKMGMLKRRVMPEDVTINIGKEAKVPDPPPGHKWKKVLHDNKVTWLASWNENILNSTKYIMLNPSSKLKGEKDWQKYETARKLKNFVDEIRKTYTEDFKSKEMRVRQRAVALYFIDKLALRAGNEKDEDTADTVGCCSLRVEHITLHEEKDGKQYVVDFDFLGKDSIRYTNSVPVEKRAYKNLKLFMENKQPGDDIFDRLNTAILNKHLNELMEGLTAKVFRTYNASNTLQEQLDLLTKSEMSIPEKILAYNRANRAVAVLCNHQRAVPKTFSKSMENLKNKMNDKLQQIKDMKKEVKNAKGDAKNGSGKDKMAYEKKRKRLQQLEDQYKKLEVEATDKEENKQIALGTSKLNYLDPRISVAWCKKWDVPIEKIYNRTQRDKFRWAIEMAGPDFKF